MTVVMGQELGQPVIIDNKPGAGNPHGTDAAVKSAPDGYTMVMATVAHVVNPSIQPKLPYNHDKDFAPVMLVGVSPNVLVVRDSSPYKSVKDIISAARRLRASFRLPHKVRELLPTSQVNCSRTLPALALFISPIAVPDLRSRICWEGRST